MCLSKRCEMLSFVSGSTRHISSAAFRRASWKHPSSLFLGTMMILALTTVNTHMCDIPRHQLANIIENIYYSKFQYYPRILSKREISGKILLMTQLNCVNLETGNLNKWREMTHYYNNLQSNYFLCISYDKAISEFIEITLKCD